MEDKEPSFILYAAIMLITAIIASLVFTIDHIVKHWEAVILSLFISLLGAYLLTPTLLSNTSFWTNLVSLFTITFFTFRFIIQKATTPLRP